jgi:hypothetical protein
LEGRTILPVDPEETVIVSLWVGRTKAGLFVRGPRGSDGTELADRFDPQRQLLERRLGANYGRTTGAIFFDRSARFDMNNRANWPAAIDWQHEMARIYLNTLKEVLPGAA